MISEIIILVVLAAGFVILKIFQSESERKRRLEREEKKLRVKASSGEFAPKKWNQSVSDESNKTS